MKQTLILTLSILLSLSVFCQKQTKEVNKLLVIKEQGSFSAGGTIVTSEGTFDPLKPWSETQGGQTRHGDHADVFYQIPIDEKKPIRWCFCLAMDSRVVAGKLLPMAEKVSRISF